MKEVYLTNAQSFESCNAALGEFPAKVKDYVTQCPTLVFAVVPKNIPHIQPVLQGIAESGGIAISTDFRSMSKDQALQLLAHYENGIAEFRKHIEDTLS